MYVPSHMPVVVEPAASVPQRKPSAFAMIVGYFHESFSSVGSETPVSSWIELTLVVSEMAS